MNEQLSKFPSESGHVLATHVFFVRGGNNINIVATHRNGSSTLISESLRMKIGHVTENDGILLYIYQQGENQLVILVICSGLFKIVYMNCSLRRP